VLIVSAITALRLMALAFSAANLGPDEAQYWAWAQQPAFGYFSKPPFIAWLIWATTSLCGDGEPCVRLAAPLLHGGTALLLFLVARTLYDARVGLLSAFAYATLPGVSFSVGIISTDVPLLFFWALALLALAKGMQRPALGPALLLGLSLGLGLLAKYAMAYFLISAAIAAAFLPRLRSFLLSWRGALALVLGAAIFAPNVAWNLKNSFATVRHTASNADLGVSLFHPGALGEFLLAQAGVFGPIFLAVLVLVLVRARPPGAEPTEAESSRLLLSFALPTLAIVSVIAFLTRAHANWAAPAYVAATPVVLHWLVAHGRKALLRASLALHIVVAVVLPTGLALPALADGLGLGNAVKRVRGWEELGRVVAARLEARDYTAVLATDRELMGELLYYVKPRRVPVVMWDWPRPPNNHYELTMRIDERTGARVLFVSGWAGPEELFARFARVEPLGTVTIALGSGRLRTTHLFALEGFAPRAP
jgi:4-amino-4-deoxy-L-arabinose transferase-like glycosyltransferase